MRTEALREPLRRRLAGAVQRSGYGATAAELGIEVPTLLRALAGGRLAPRVIAAAVAWDRGA